MKDGKSIKHWRENKTTKAFLEALSSNTGIPIIGLIESKAGGTDAGGAGRCGQFLMMGGGENLGRTGWPILHLRNKQFTNTQDDCALQEYNVVPQDPFIQGMSGDAEGFRRIHERHGDVQREARQENERLVAPTDH